ncbi:hypothetical protein AU468_07885 [Alkalispirochaeta sphaeroplastigenens]|uniref:IstB-like ATP-binding domain-containing protein n=1 Tax=Alkalispirochaeta sphaeroplastigenens TaxID=1187066 RepID=A0A2S4JQ91_9SPIO|nr:hypothetical protein AU468_07885 [Alkalispirochaeta sphaeroplastigenens]
MFMLMRKGFFYAHLPECKHLCKQLYRRNLKPIPSRKIGTFAEKYFIYDICPYIQGRLIRGYTYSRNHADIQRGILTRHILPVFRDAYFDDLTTLQIEEWVLGLVNSIMSPGNRTVGKIRVARNTGPTGCGKSYLGSAFGHQACQYGHTVAYFLASRLFNEIEASKADGTLPEESPPESLSVFTGVHIPPGHRKGSVKSVREKVRTPFSHSQVLHMLGNFAASNRVIHKLWVQVNTGIPFYSIKGNLHLFESSFISQLLEHTKIEKRLHIQSSLFPIAK